MLSFINKTHTFIGDLLTRPGIRLHSSNISWMLVARIGGMFISFLAIAVLARKLGPNNYGELSYAISFVSLFSFLASFGVEQILHRELVKRPFESNRILGSALLLRFVTSSIACVITLLAALLFSAKDVSLLVIFILSTGPIIGTFQLIGYEFQARHQSKYPSILSLVVVLLLNILKIFVVISGGGVLYLALVLLCEPIFYSLGYLYLKQKYSDSLFTLVVKKAEIFDLLKYSFPLIFSSAFALLYTRIDQVMIKNMLNAHAVGLYDAAVRISELFYFLPQIILLSFFPAIVKMRENNIKLYFRRLNRLLIFLLIIAFSISTIAGLLSPLLISIIYGEQFIGASLSLQIYVWGIVGVTLTSFTQQILLIEGKTSLITISAFFGMMLNVILNLILIPKYGIEGAAIATFVAYLIPFFSLFLFKNVRIILTHILRPIT